MDLFVPPAKRDKDQITIRDDVSGGIKVLATHFSSCTVIVHGYRDSSAVGWVEFKVFNPRVMIRFPVGGR